MPELTSSPVHSASGIRPVPPALCGTRRHTQDSERAAVTPPNTCSGGGRMGHRLVSHGSIQIGCRWATPVHSELVAAEALEDVALRASRPHHLEAVSGAELPALLDVADVSVVDRRARSPTRSTTNFGHIYSAAEDPRLLERRSRMLGECGRWPRTDGCLLRSSEDGAGAANLCGYDVASIENAS